MEKLNREQPEALHMALTGQYNFFLTGSAGELIILGL